MLSVVVPTNRIGGMDLLFDSLERQTHRDFELILVDAVAPFRKLGSPKYPVAPGFHPNARIPLQWLDPCSYKMECSYMRSMNLALQHARGETVVFMPDYSWLHPDCLATHAEAQKRTPGPVCLDYRYVSFPPTKPGLPSYRETIPGTPENAEEYGRQCNANAARYVADMVSGKLNEFMWSIFAEPVTAETIEKLPLEHEHKPSTADLASDWNWCSLKNESIPTELLLDMNGFDEAYDGSHLYQDSELSYRLRARGIRWHHGGPGGMLTVVNPRNWSNIKTLGRPLFSNQELCFNSRRAELHLPVNPGFSLRERRNARLAR